MQDFEEVIKGLTVVQKAKARAAKADIEAKLSFAGQGRYFIEDKNGTLRLGFRLEGDGPWVLTFRKL